jgi:riboflavin kinase/FMN adenylyltransferase
VMPAPGIYAALAHESEVGTDVPAAVSIGVRPTFEEDGDLRIEAHLVGFEGDLYGRDVRLDFLERLRDELRFESVEELVEQMKEDVEQTREAVARAREP